MSFKNRISRWRARWATGAGKASDGTLAESRSKRFSGWIENDIVAADLYFLPFVQVLLTSLAQSRPLVFIMDGSEAGGDFLAMVTNSDGQRILQGCQEYHRG